MSFPRYPRYKPSGVEWLGEVPEQWNVTPFKWHIQRNDGGVWGQDPTGADDTVVLRSTEQTVDGHWRIDDPASRQLSQDEISAALLLEGDLLLTKSSGSSLHIGKTTLVTAEIAAMRCCYSNFMQRIRTMHSFRPELAWYVLNSELARRQFDLLSNSTTGLANLNGSLIGQLIVPAPPVSEQLAIASFLDSETAKIDALVSEQERLIELLAEKRQAVISHAVTRGLNPNAPMKPSGIEWLGEVPEHWQAVKLGTQLTETPCYGVLVPDFDPTGVPMLRITDMESGHADRAALVTISRQLSDQYSRTIVHEGDVVLSVVGSIGEVMRIPAALEGINISRAVARIQPQSSLHAEFLCWLFRSGCFQRYTDLVCVGTAQRVLNMSDLRAFRLGLPPLPEQLEIIRALGQRLTELEQLTKQARAGSDLLKERRSALISAAVTGQIDVRNLAPQDSAA